jgi:hypothetical protein
MSSFLRKQVRLKALETLELRVKQFRGREEIWPFRVPHEPIDFDLAELQPRMVLRMEWPSSTWELSAIALPSGILLYADSDGRESRILASVKRGSPSEADGFFLERLAESRGRLFGIEMAGPPPERVRSTIGDREFLADVFVDLFEGTPAESDIRVEAPDGLRLKAPADVRLKTEATGPLDFRADLVRWLDRVLVAPSATRRQPRLADAFE